MEGTGVWVLLFAFTILLTFFLLILSYWYAFWYTDRSHAISPYTGLPLRRASEISYYSAEKVWRYLKESHQYDNQPINLKRAALCRETGRIFPNSVTLLDTIKVDWTFLQKRYPGNYVSWGSLNRDQQEAIRKVHDSLEGFQIEMSCPEPAPRAIDPQYVYIKPGPLYVDLESQVLLGWKEIPGTGLEVLIVQKPSKQEFK
jgi:hypothetical protein